ncbi:MAG TPA: hydrogenase maturation nickel metallochaperone HypA [Gammaproteobacteria bacterium]|nr:hydrogenase maturation nickel metallochaperone HypA [Gammaproteobacteria bacterium]
MHEMSICESLISIIEEQAKQQDFSQVKVVRLEIGPLAGVEIEALRFSYDVVTRGSIAEKSKLEVITLPLNAWCMPCGETVIVQQRFDACPKCASHQVQITGGDELRIKDMEVN